MATETLLELRQVSKRYPGTLAVDRVDLSVCRGEVHALMGENGAGKSTLMQILAGSFRDYTGTIRLGDRVVSLRSPAAARAEGVAMIHQELSLAGPLSVAENLLVGRLPRRGPFLDRRRLLSEARRLLARVGLALDPRQRADRLSQHEAQLVEIAKALGTDPAILVMDEPTSALSRAEVKRLFALIADLKAQGVTILYISHHLSEVYTVADRITVLRDGRWIATVPTADVDPPSLVAMMIGRPAEQAAIRRRRAPGRKRLRVRGLSRRGVFQDIRLHVRAGEILGIGGLAGSGRTELARALCGLDTPDAGAVWLDGRPVELGRPRWALRHGIVYLTEDRKQRGLALEQTAGTNLLSACHVQRGRLLPGRRRRAIFQRHAQALQLTPPLAERPAAQFSGGNQQKILLGKCLATDPQVLILDEPTRGVDVGAKQVIHEAIAQRADSGACVLLISSDLPELVTLADRIQILRRGRLVGELGPNAMSENAVLLMASTDPKEPAHA